MWVRNLQKWTYVQFEIRSWISNLSWIWIYLFTKHFSGILNLNLESWIFLNLGSLFNVPYLAGIKWLFENAFSAILAVCACITAEDPKALVITFLQTIHSEDIDCTLEQIMNVRRLDPSNSHKETVVHMKYVKTSEWCLSFKNLFLLSGDLSNYWCSYTYF